MALSADRYQCTRCGACCRWSGYVRLTTDEAEAIAAYVGLTVEAFTAQHTVLTNDRRGLSLREKPDGTCAWLEGDSTCRIYAVRPQQCRGFPNTWRFPGFERDCRARDTAAESAGEAPADPNAPPAAGTPGSEP